MNTLKRLEHTMKDYKISIVMGYQNRRPQLLRTLRSISKSIVKNFEVIVVDDCSVNEHKIVDLPNKFDFDLKIVELRSDEKWWVNPCVVFNKGFKQATGKIILIQSPECLHVGDVLEYTSRNVREGTYLVFSSLGVSEKFSRKLSKIDFTSLDLSRLRREIVAKLPEGMFDTRIVDENIWYCHPRYRSWAPHFTPAILRGDLDELNGFDERYAYGYDFDDMEFYTRIKRRNFNVWALEPRDYPFTIHQYHRNTNTKKDNRRNRELYHNTTLKESGYRVNEE